MALLVVVCSILGLPWAHGALPQSPMHVRALAEVSGAGSVRGKVKSEEGLSVETELSTSIDS